ncbi:MAG: hypothetical protein ABSG65_16355 [Bryobacteraceae bacterium]
MAPDGRDEPSMIAYLLGLLPQDAAAALEASFFTDERLFDDLCLAETELIHAYLRGEFTGPRLKRFEEVYSSTTARARRLAAEREWFEAAKLVAKNGAATHNWLFRKLFRTGRLLNFAVVFAFLILVLDTLWLVHRITGIELAVRTVRSDLAMRFAERQPLASFVLTPGLTRGASAPKRLQLPAGAAQVRFELQVDGPAKQDAASAILQVVDGYEVWSGRVLRTEGGLSVVVPTSVLTRNDYKLTLGTLGQDGKAETAPSYLFSVTGR